MDILLEIAEKYGDPEDAGVNESLVRALEAHDDSDRKVAVDGLVALNDLHAASRIYWVALNGSKRARLAAVEVLGKLCFDMLTIETLVKVFRSDKNRYVRYKAADALKRKGLRRFME